jgi:hypothetical protein|tara:strand:+ start:226 stop:474 length:249 start_codon:yes stop_codon:yes gene_type:complete
MHLVEVHGMLTMEKEVDLEVQVLEDMLLLLVVKDQEVLEILEGSLHLKEIVVEQAVTQITKLLVVAEVLLQLEVQDQVLIQE